MLCYRCGSHVPDTAESCGTCGQKLSGGGVRQATATFSRRKLQASIENAPYKIGDVIGERYEIKDVVGAGPVGFVFRAMDKQVDVEVALKVVNPRLVQTPDERKQFAKAMRLGRKLAHQNLIRVYEEGEDQDRPFFTMQFLEGLTLRKIIDLRTQKGEFFALREIEPILGQIANALDGAHKVGAHSNLKPENVIVLPDLLKVADFGLALAIPHLPFVQAAKQRKADRYLSPEYVQGHEVDQRADLYALGVIIGEMLSGLTPDGAIPELMRRNPDVPPQLEGLYRKALNSNPLARPKSGGELFEEFAEITRRVSPPPLNKRTEGVSQPAVSRSRPSIAPPIAAAATMEVRRRGVDKPPPPVPDIESIDVPLHGSSGIEELPPDATQPLDVDSFPRPPPPPADVHETQLMPSFPGIVSGVELIGEPTESRPIPGTAQPNRGSRAGVMFFVMFTLLGLTLGAGGGYWLLKRVRQPQQPVAMAPPDPRAVPPLDAPTPKPDIELAGGPVAASGRTAGTAPQVQLDPPIEADGRKTAETRRFADERRKIDDAATAAAQKNELLRLKAEKQRAEEQRRAQEALLAEQQREADAVKRAAEERRKVAAAQEAERLAAAQKNDVVAVAATVPKKECPDGMKFINAGNFKMGTSRDDPMMGFDEKILASTSVSAYCIDIYEYPNRRGGTPKVGVSWADAQRSCEGRGKRLCSESEWERACKGPGNARYPYGNTYDADACNTEDELGEDRPLATSGRFQKCRSGFGIADMSGNAAEWTESSYSGGADKAQKGGSFSKPDYAARCSARKNGSPGSRGADIGFRCCADP